MANYESENTHNGSPWFALDAGAGLVYSLGDCEDFEAAEQVAEEKGIQAVWIADADTARQWMRCIQERLDG